MRQLMAGAARVKLEPPIGLAMLGYGNRVGRSTGVHDELAAQALVLSDGAKTVAIVGVDVLALGNRIADDIRTTVAAESDIAADAILIGATHTHSGPAFNIFATPRADAKVADDRSLEWERALPGKIAGAVLNARRQLEPASLRAATARFTLGTNRRLIRPNGQIQLAANYSGVADTDAMVFGVYREDNSALSFVMNYPCHGVVLCEDNLLYSRDWMGFAMDEIETAAAATDGRRPISIFLQGATGNIDPRSRGSFEVAAENGRAMGRAAFDALTRAQSSTDPRITFRRVPLRLKLKNRQDEIATARLCVEQTHASLDNHRGGEGYQMKRLRDHHDQSLAALRGLEAAEEQERHDRRVDIARREMRTSITVLAAGDAAFIGIPGELFVEFGLELKANQNFAHTFVAGYCNDLIGYIPTSEAYAQGGYEVESARVAPGSGETIVAAALAALADIRTTLAESTDD